jgi:hypothetical protein
MLQDCNRRFLKVANQTSRRADVENVVKRQVLAVQFFKVPIKITVERCFLMGIFAVTQVRHQWHRQ